MSTITVNSKKITIYDLYDSPTKSLPIIVYNSFQGNAEDIFNTCQHLNTSEFIFVFIEDIDWNNEMTPYFQPPLFKNDTPYQGLASNYLNQIEHVIIPEVKSMLSCTITDYILCGYSLAGLFAINAIPQTSLFTKFISCSGSLWYPNFISFFQTEPLPSTIKVYLSLGNTEKNSHGLTSSVETKTTELYTYLLAHHVTAILKLNEGNHFQDVPLRVALGIAWILQ